MLTISSFRCIITLGFIKVAKISFLHNDEWKGQSDLISWLREKQGEKSKKSSKLCLN